MKLAILLIIELKLLVVVNLNAEIVSTLNIATRLAMVFERCKPQLPIDPKLMILLLHLRDGVRVKTS